MSTIEPEQDVRVQLAYEYTDADGKTHQPDDVIAVPESVARRLMTEGRARTPDDEEHRVAAASGVRLSGTDLDKPDVTVEQLQEEIRARNAEGADLKVTGPRDELIKRLREDDANRA
jgi:hypothetical protein